MSIIDIIFIIFILIGGYVGFKQGFTKSVVNFLGIIIITGLSFFLKNPLSRLFMNIFPFFPFSGFLKGVTVLNIVLYELLAFMTIFIILFTTLKIVSKTSSIFEKILSFTIILGIPSKILGAIFGILKNYVIVFFVIYYLAMPNFSDFSIVSDSKLKDPILKNTPFLSLVANNSLKVMEEFSSIKEKYINTDNNNQFNLETLDIFLKYHVTTVETVRDLTNSGKIKVEGIDNILEKYEGK